MKTRYHAIAVLNSEYRSTLTDELARRGILLTSADVPERVAALAERLTPCAVICDESASPELLAWLTASLKPAKPLCRILYVAEAVDEALRLELLEQGWDAVEDRSEVVAATEWLAGLGSEADRAAGTVSGTSSMVITIGSSNLAHVVQFISHNRRTGLLEVVFTETGDVGYIFTDGQRITHAQFGLWEGVEAVAHMLNAGGGHGQLIEERTPAKTTISVPVDSLLVQAGVLSDELRQDES